MHINTSRAKQKYVRKSLIDPPCKYQFAMPAPAHDDEFIPVVHRSFQLMCSSNHSIRSNWSSHTSISNEFVSITALQQASHHRG